MQKLMTQSAWCLLLLMINSIMFGQPAVVESKSLSREFDQLRSSSGQGVIPDIQRGAPGTVVVFHGLHGWATMKIFSGSQVSPSEIAGFAQKLGVSEELGSPTLTEILTDENLTCLELNLSKSLNSNLTSSSLNYPIGRLVSQLRSSGCGAEPIILVNDKRTTGVSALVSSSSISNQYLPQGFVMMMAAKESDSVLRFETSLGFEGLMRFLMPTILIAVFAIAGKTILAGSIYQAAVAKENFSVTGDRTPKFWADKYGIAFMLSFAGCMLCRPLNHDQVMMGGLAAAPFFAVFAFYLVVLVFLGWSSIKISQSVGLEKFSSVSLCDATGTGVAKFRFHLISLVCVGLTPITRFFSDDLRIGLMFCALSVGLIGRLCPNPKTSVAVSSTVLDK